MAILDTRLIPLIETLVDAGADWLAFEIIDGIQRGRVDEETLDTLVGARRVVRTDRRPARQSEEALSLPTPSEPIAGDDQIDWAIEYVNKRVSDAIQMLNASLDVLDAIVQPEITAETPAPLGVTLVAEDELEGPPIDRASVTMARTGLEELQRALALWAASARGGASSE